jgi:hypothetical protein
MDLKSMAATAERVVEEVMKVEPIAMTALSFIPQAKPIVAIVHPAVVAAAPFIENALNSLATGNNGDALTALIQLIQHVTPGQPNSNLLSASPGPIAGTSSGASSASASAQGSA